jgi:hypothetical protein
MRGFFVSIPFIINFSTMNHIILIGNGFDLAHGLKTSYIDFLTWYINDINENMLKYQIHKDDLVEIYFKQRAGYSEAPPSLNNSNLTSSPFKFFENIRAYRYNVDFKGELGKSLFNNLHIENWVDIENTYYQCLVSIYKDSIKGIGNINHIRILNSNFSFLKRKLIEYLKSIEDTSIDPIQEIKNHLDLIYKNKDTQHVLFLNFNYTNLIRKYLSYYPSQPTTNTINIHGSLTDDENKIIFGYGDETDEFYEKIENLNNNDYLKFIKAFGYAHEDNYQNLYKFINDNQYKIHIFGHSCGLSDRVLLKELFENDRCNEIIIYYHQSEENKNDYFNKLMDISRHFSLQNKGKMRIRIRDFKQSKPLVNYIKQ